MNKKLQIGWIAILMLLFAAPLYSQKVVKVKGVQGRWQVSDNVTLKEAEERALMEAKKEALSRAGVMENVWSVFGQITQESGTELMEAYSQMNVLAIGGMLNVTSKKVEEIWDIQEHKLYKVVTIDAEVKKDVSEDKTYALEVIGIAPLYKEGDVMNFKLKVRGADSHLKFFWFDSEGGSLVFPNEYEKDFLLEAEKEYQVPFSPYAEYKMYKQGKESEKINLMWVVTKQNIPFTGEVTYESVLKWIYAIPNDQRCAAYEMALVK